MASISISDVFPALSPTALANILRDLGLTATDPVANLAATGEAMAETLNAIASHVIESSIHLRLDQIAPVLSHDDCSPLQLEAFTTRSANALVRCGVYSWRELAVLTPADLFRLPAVGRKSVTEIIATALRRAAARALHAANSNLATSVASMMSPSDAEESNASNSTEPNKSNEVILGRSVVQGLQTLMRWAACIGNVTTVGAALELSRTELLPDDVTTAMREMLETPIPWQGGTETPIATAYEHLWNACGDERDKGIFSRRISLTPPTLDYLGAELELTRERVRQLKRAAEERVLAALSRSQCAEIRWRAVRLRQQLGSAISQSNGTLRAALDAACRGISEPRSRAETVMLWAAGPYRLDKQTGWLLAESEYSSRRVGPSSEIGPPPRSSLLGAISNELVIDIEFARAKAASAGLVSAAIEDWIDLCPVRDIGGTLVLWNGNVVDKAMAILEIIGQPTSADEINSIIDEGHSVRGLRNRLLGDQRFLRTDRSRIGLRKWGLEEYSGIVDEIEEEILRKGGEAEVVDLVETLAERFGLRNASVLSYTSVPRFVVADGCIHIRRPDEPFVPSRSLFIEPHVFLLEESRCAYRLPIDQDVLRGSGRPLPQGVAIWLGVLPGMRREFQFQDGDLLLVSWPDSALLGPTLGSLRRQALARSGAIGDYILLEFDRSTNEVVAILVSQSELHAAPGWVRGTLLTGLDAASRDEFEHLLAAAVGVSDAADARRRCRDRGEPELAELVRAETPADLEEALERLKGLL